MEILRIIPAVVTQAMTTAAQLLTDHTATRRAGSRNLMEYEEWQISYLTKHILRRLSEGKKHNIYTVEEDVLDHIRPFLRNNFMQLSRPGRLLNHPFCLLGWILVYWKRIGLAR